MEHLILHLITVFILLLPLLATSSPQQVIYHQPYTVPSPHLVPQHRHRYPKGTVLQEDPLVYQMKRVVQSMNKFSNRFFNVINEDQNESGAVGATEGIAAAPLPPPSSTDLVYSPMTIFTSLSTLRSGSADDTFHELGTVLSLSKVNESVLEQGIGLILESVSHPTDKGSVNLINKLFLDSQLQPRNSYVNRVTDKFYGELVQTHFSNATAATRFVNTNMFVASHGALQDVLAIEEEEEEELEHGSGNLSTTKISVPLAIDGGLMLVSGLTLEADWERSFTPLLTRKEPFYREDGSISEANMMHRDGVYYFAEIPELNATALSIPYKGFRFSFTILLPEERISIAELEQNLESFPFLAVLSRLKKQYVQLSLPKFQVESTLDLVGTLEKMGVTRVFTETTAELDRMVDEESSGYSELYLTNAVHKTLLDVSEGGSRVPAANFIEAVPATARYLTPFTANRPFVFFVSDQLLNTILIAGRKVV